MSVIKEILTLYVERADWFAELLLGHIALALTAIVLSGTIGLLVGVLISEHQRIASPIMGVLTPQPCVPVTAAPWAPGSPTVLVGGKPAVNNTCKCMCNWGGVIQIVNPGPATTTMVP